MLAVSIIDIYSESKYRLNHSKSNTDSITSSRNIDSISFSSSTRRPRRSLGPFFYQLHSQHILATLTTWILSTPLEKPHSLITQNHSSAIALPLEPPLPLPPLPPPSRALSRLPHCLFTLRTWHPAPSEARASARSATPLGCPISLQSGSWSPAPPLPFAKPARTMSMPVRTTARAVRDLGVKGGATAGSEASTLSCHMYCVAPA